MIQGNNAVMLPEFKILVQNNAPVWDFVSYLYHTISDITQAGREILHECPISQV